MGGYRWLKFLLYLLVVTALTTGCNVLQPKEQDDKLPVLTIGSDIYPPFVYMNEKGEPDGVDVELAKEACRRMGYRPEFVAIDWKQKDELLAGRRVDCLWGCFSMKGRENKYKWTKPYMISSHAVAVAKESNIYHLADLKDKVVAVQVTTQPEKIFLQNKDKRIPPVRQVVTVDGGDILYSMLVNSRVDAIAGHREAIEQYAKDYGKDYRILEEPLLQSHIGVAFYKDDQRELVNKLSDALEDMESDGTLAKIASKYLSDVDYYLMAGDSSGT